VKAAGGGGTLKRCAVVRGGVYAYSRDTGHVQKLPRLCAGDAAYSREVQDGAGAANVGEEVGPAAAVEEGEFPGGAGDRRTYRCDAAGTGAGGEQGQKGECGENSKMVTDTS
jgi:hypothetical protein